MPGVNDYYIRLALDDQSPTHRAAILRAVEKKGRVYRAALIEKGKAIAKQRDREARRLVDEAEAVVRQRDSEAAAREREEINQKIKDVLSRADQREKASEPRCTTRTIEYDIPWWRGNRYMGMTHHTKKVRVQDNEKRRQAP